MTSDTEDEDLKEAIALSLQYSPDCTGAHAQDGLSVVSHNPALTSPTVQGAALTGNALYALDRKTMETQRLARLAARSLEKRERSISPPDRARSPKRMKGSHKIPAKAPPEEVKPTATDLTYPKGVIKKTWAYGHERKSDDIKIEEVLERATLRTAVLSAFQWDTEWLYNKINPNTKLIFVMQAKTREDRDRLRQEAEAQGESLRLCFPPMEGQVNCMHSKLMLLFHPHKLRIAIPSANLVKYDWGETGIMENSVFLIDLPRKQKTLDSQPEASLPPFAKELFYFLEKSGLGIDVRGGMENFDYTATAGLAFVHSVGGGSFGEDMNRTGHLGLSQAVNQLGMQTTNLKIDFAASSIGSLDDNTLRILYRSARGSGLQNIPASNKPTTAVAMKGQLDITKSFHVYFPTHDTVKSSTGGIENGGTICLQRKWFTSTKFPKACFRDYKSVRTGMLSHNKILYARGRTAEHAVAWAYVGSANLSESAWGKLTFDRLRKEPKINCRNWECGVLMPVATYTHTTRPSMETDELREHTAIPDMTVFDGVVKVPFEYPAEDYSDRQPWYFTEC